MKKLLFEPVTKIPGLTGLSKKFFIELCAFVSLWQNFKIHITGMFFLPPSHQITKNRTEKLLLIQLPNNVSNIEVLSIPAFSVIISKRFIWSRLIFIILLFTVNYNYLISENILVNKIIQTVYIELDNSASIEINIDFGNYSRDTLLIPVNNKSVDKIKINDSTDFSVELIKNFNERYIRIIRNKIKKPGSAVLSFRDRLFYKFDKSKKSDFGNYTLNYKFINTGNCEIDRFISRIFLPAGFAITSIEESYPKISNKTSESPYEIIQVDGRNGVEIKNSKMILGDNCFIIFRFKDDSKSNILLFSLFIIALGYLVFFRDLIKNKNQKNNK